MCDFSRVLSRPHFFVYGGVVSGNEGFGPLNLIYQLGVAVVTWFGLVPWQLLEIVRGRATWGDLSERMGWSTVPGPRRGGRAVIHAVSAGEMAAVEPVIAELARREPGLGVVLTTCCADGRAVAERIRERCPAVESVMWLPWDRIGPLRRWLAGLGPSLVVVVETEIWPGLFFACRRLGLPLCVVNGRIYQRDVWRYRMALPFFRRALGCVSWIGAQSSAEAARFAAIGAEPAHIEVVGNPKYAFVPPGASGDDRLGRLANAGPLVVAGSTHEPEEALVLAAFRNLRCDIPELRLVLAPRKVDRWGGVAALVERAGFRAAAWSTWGADGGPWDVLILDRLGWLAEIYGRARMAVVGGSFIEHGGHNPIEAAAQGIPVIMGPSARHFEEIVGDLEAAGGLIRVGDAAGLAAAMRHLIEDPARAEMIGSAGKGCVAARQGIAGRYASALLARRIMP